MNSHSLSEVILPALLLTLTGWASALAASDITPAEVLDNSVTLGVAEQRARTPELRVQVDPRVELFSLLFRLAGNPEYNQAKVQSYSADVDRYFDRFKDHPVVQLARQLRATRGVSYDACMSMAVHVNDANNLELIVPLEPWPDGLDTRWTPGNTSNFLMLARQFVADTDFPKFLTAHQSLYEKTTSRMQSFMEQEAHLEWFYEYFGERPQATFIVVPALLNGGSCYGAHCRDKIGREQLYCILGVWQTDAAGLPEFDSNMLGTIVHEFCHSYANAIIDRHRTEVDAAGQKLFRPVADQMRSQAYGNAATMLRESLVRACTVRYTAQYEGAEAAAQAVRNEERRGFRWTGELSNLLAEYEAHRDQYPTLESFSPRLIAFFDEYARKFQQQESQLAAKRPQVLSMTPQNGANDVDPALTEIQVTFDRPMQDGSWSLVGGGPHCPETTGKPHYDAKRTTWRVPVRLKPEWQYEFYLNRGQYDSFRSAEGVPLESVRVTFTTTTAGTNQLRSGQ